MKLNLSPITCDLDNEFEKAFADWYSNNRPLTKELIMLGYSSFAFGAARYYQEHYAKSQNSLWQENKQKIHALEKEKQELTASIERGIQEQVTAALAFKDRDIQRLTDHIDRLNKELADIKQRETDARESELQALRAQHQDSLALAKRELQLQAQQQLEAARAEIERLKNDAALRELRAAAQFQRETADKLAALSADAARYKQLYEDARDALTTRLDGMLKAAYDSQLTQLQQQLDERDTTLAILKKSNAGKGTLGETAIAQYLRQNFPDAEVIDTGKVKHSCDIHLKGKDARFIAVESKYKETITKQDVDKFVADTDYLARTAGHTTFRGALFISLRTRNIPGKGDLHLEFKAQKPMLYLGLGLTTDATLDPADPFLRQCITLLGMVGDYVSTLQHQENDVRALLNGIQPLLTNIARLRKSVLAVKDSNKKIIDSITDMEKELTDMFNRVHNMTHHIIDVDAQ